MVAANNYPTASADRLLKDLRNLHGQAQSRKQKRRI
tara:strand:- start:19347 stop:19454 length:108 start_codon:yes stop_codon:yes gene_type:complete